MGPFFSPGSILPFLGAQFTILNSPIPPLSHHMPPATLQSRPAVAEGRNFFYQGVLFWFFSTRIKLFIISSTTGGESSAAVCSINNKITTRGLNLVFGPAAHFFGTASSRIVSRTVRLESKMFFGCKEIFLPVSFQSPCTSSLAHHLHICTSAHLHKFTGFFLDNSLVPGSSCLLPTRTWWVGQGLTIIWFLCKKPPRASVAGDC